MSRTSERELRHAMVETCRGMNEAGINQGTAGNLSARCGEGFLITPSSMPYARMKPRDLLLMRFDGSYDGEHRPSSEWRFHRDILRDRQDVQSVLHCHSAYATSLAVHHKPIPAFHYMVAVAGGSTIRCSRYATFGTQALSDAVLEALEGRNACLMGQHGQIALAATPARALALAVEVETIARMYIHALSIGIGEPPVLDEPEMARVIEQMRRMSYGMPADLDGVNDVATPRRQPAGEPDPSRT